MEVGSGRAPRALARSDLRYLGWLRWRRPACMVAGTLFLLVGGLYGVWAAERIGEPDRPAFDRPVARLAGIFAPYEERLRALTPETEREAELLDMLREQTRATKGLLLFAVRFLLASAALTAGLVLLTHAFATARLEAIVHLLRKEPDADG